MRKLLLFLLPVLILIGSTGACSFPGAGDDMPAFVRFVVQNDEGAPITEGVSLTYIENGEEKSITDFEIEPWRPDYPGEDTFATHWKSRYMPERASFGLTTDFYLKHNGYTDTLTLLYKDREDMDYERFLLNGEEIRRDMSKLWPHNYITINRK